MPYKDPEAKRRYMARYYEPEDQDGRDSLRGASKKVLRSYEFVCE